MECGKSVGINTFVDRLNLYCDCTIMCGMNATTNIYCLLSYLTSTTLIAPTVVEELAHNLVHCSSKAPS